MSLVALALFVLAPVQELGKSPGSLYPDVELPTIDRERTLRLSELRGKRVLLIEFASW